MSEDAAKYNINMTEISTKLEGEGYQLAQVQAVMTLAGDETIWNKVEDLFSTIAAKQKDIVDGDPDLVFLPLPMPVDPSDPQVINIAKFAVKEHNKQAKTQLTFNKVIFGLKWNLVACTLYALLIETVDDKGTHRSVALVLTTIVGFKTLIWYLN